MSSHSVEAGPTGLARLKELAEFRYELRRFLGFSETVTESVGVAAQQYQLMQVIEALPAGQKASITYLAERMVLRHNSTVELVDRAERAGLVRRQSDLTDMRRSLIELTETGRQTLSGLIDRHLAELDLNGHKICDALQLVLASAHTTAPVGQAE